LAKDRVTGRDVILAIGENMGASLEPLVTKTIAPSLYQVYLHPDDYDHLRTLFGELESEAKALLDGELARLNRGSSPSFSRILRKKDAAPAPPKFVSAEGKWTIRFQEDPNGTLNPGDLEVVSEFARPPEAGYGAGSKTHRISTTRKFGQPQMTTKRDTTAAVVAPPGAIGTPAMAAMATMDSQAAALARLVYQDDRGRHTFLMTKDEIVIGRQAPDVWADLSLDTSLDVSREHARLQRTPEGKFRIKDLSKLGTTVNGAPLPRSLEAPDGAAQDLGQWMDLPDKARIGLAGVIYLDFERTAGA
jgi:FHA domain